MNHFKNLNWIIKEYFKSPSSSVACLSEKIKRPPNTTSVVEVIVGVAVGITVLAGLAAILSKK